MADARTARAISHVDMDAFYAAVEQRDRPELRGLPVIVGADPRGRGVVSACSYEARVFGVRSAMPISRAHRLCPHGVYLPVDMDKYGRVSTEIMAILADFTPLVEPVSVDEAFLDLTGTETLWGPPLEAVRRIKGRIRAETGLTASAGLAANKFVAKVASDLEKPDGLVVVQPGGEAAFLAPLPIERLWGVGKATAKELDALGVTTIGQLQRLSPAVLEARLGPHGSDLLDLAFGRDTRAVEPFAPPKSMGAENTFGHDTHDVAKIQETLRAQAERVARELRAAGLAACRITLKLRWADFHTVTRSHTGDPTQDGLEIYRRAATMLAREPMVQAVRLIGVSASTFRAQALGQLPLLDPAAVRREQLARAVDRITARFGRSAILPARLLGSDAAEE
ncbi:MAG TPA: DNA polymerase IV [Methylomirabilota bacterium]|jgi:DNA polymerase-4|nr:DNA polymerase IV [Methylomirabilota bacterium]